MEASQSHRIAREPSGGRFVVALLLFATSAVIAVLLLLTALVVWLSALTGSFIASTLILGALFGILAAVIYLLSVREVVERIRTRAETVYEVARAARSGYEWLVEKAAFLFRRERARRTREGPAGSRTGPHPRHRPQGRPTHVARTRRPPLPRRKAGCRCEKADTA